MVILILNIAVSPFDILVYNWVWISLVKGLELLSYENYKSGAIHESLKIILGYRQITHEPDER